MIALAATAPTARAASTPPAAGFGPEPGTARAERPAEDSALAGEEEPGRLERAVGAVHTGISDAVERTAMRVDSFFADDRFYADSTESYARLSLQTTWEDGDGTASEARLRVRVDLPGTEHRLRLFVEGGEPDGAEGTASNSIPRALDDNDYNVGLEGQLDRTGAWDLRPGLGVKAGVPPDPFVRLRAIRYENFARWLMRFSTGAAQYLDAGTEVLARLDFDRDLGEQAFFRSGSRARYRRQDDRIELRHDFSLFRRMGRRGAIAYDVGLVADDDPDWDIDNYFTQVRARWRVYQKWLFLELTPQIIFREEDDYDASFRVSLRVDAVFGDRYRGPAPPVVTPPASLDGPDPSRWFAQGR